MEQLHPVLPTQEQLEQGEEDRHNEREHADVLLIQAFQAGADQELEACCEWMANRYGNESHAMELLRAARRPNPTSLKQQALAALDRLNSGAMCINPVTDKNTIRRALESLPD